MWLTGTVPAESEAVQLAGHTDTVACVAIDPSGEIVATGGMDGVTRLWDIASGELKAALEGPTEALEWLDWHPKGTVLAVGSQDMTSWMFNGTSGVCMQVFTGHAGAVMAGAAQVLLPVGSLLSPTVRCHCLTCLCVSDCCCAYRSLCLHALEKARPRASRAHLLLPMCTHM